MRLCFIGDSYVNGTGDESCLGWVGRLGAEARRRGCDITLYNLGIRGNTSADIAARWEAEARARLPPDQDGRLVFSFGVNDCLAAAPDRAQSVEADSIANARGIVVKAKAWLPMLMIGPPPTADEALNRRIESLSRRLGALCAELAVPFFPPWEPLRASEIWRREVAAGDGAHPSGKGYHLLAELILAWPVWRSWVGLGSDGG